MPTPAEREALRQIVKEAVREELLRWGMDSSNPEASEKFQENSRWTTKKRISAEKNASNWAGFLLSLLISILTAILTISSNWWYNKK
jgi:hypothetical protein